MTDALRRMPAAFECYTVESEFWWQMTDPNRMVEISPRDLGDLVTATTFHVGEVLRNPYHLLLPAWMMDNVRRGGELLGGQGGAVPNYTIDPIPHPSSLSHFPTRRRLKGPAANFPDHQRAWFFPAAA